jgi:HlyD family secretion protein
MSARANIFIGNGKKRLAVPVEAISTEIGEDKKVINYVWMVRDGLASKVSIRTEESDDRWQGIGRPLAQGDVVVIGPAKTLRLLQPGDRVAQRARGGVDAGERRDRGATE